MNTKIDLSKPILLSRSNWAFVGYLLSRKGLAPLLLLCSPLVLVCGLMEFTSFNAKIFSLLFGAGFVSVAGMNLYFHYSARYRIDADTLSARLGIVARQVHEVKTAHVRSVSVNQSVIGRMLNYGDVEFATAGTDGSDVVFGSVNDPFKIRAYVNELKERDKSAESNID